MTTQDDQFLANLRVTFAAEADELLQSISSKLLELEKLPLSPPLAPAAAGLVENVYREAHTLKGAARAVDLTDVEAICQRLEDVFHSWKRQISHPTVEAFDSLHRAVDTIKQAIGPKPSPAATAPADAAMPAEPDRAAADQTVRISIDKLDSRLLQAEDMLVLKTITSQRAMDLRELSQRLAEWQREWSKVSAHARALRHAAERAEPADAPASAGVVNFLDWNSDFLRSLENKLASLAAQTQQDHHEIGKRVDDLLESSKKLLMLPFSTLANQLPRLVRDLCREQQKEAEFVILGGEVEIDKRILEELKDALIHILRNCIDHGVETPTRRAQLRKPAAATITLAASPINGSKVEILISDDGAGIDLPRVRESAVRHAILSRSEADALEDSEAMKLIFRSEVSTSPTITTLSGRGLGMAIVHAKAEKLGGGVYVESTRDGGTTLRIILPLTLSTFRGIIVAIGEGLFVIPTTHVERIVRVEPSDIRTVENREVISVQERAVSLVRLRSILELPPPARPADGEAAAPVVLVHVGAERIAIAVDEVLREEEVLVKPLRKPLVRVRNVAGATVLGSGKVALVLNIVDVMKSARGAGAVPAPAIDVPRPRAASAKRVLIVEDSITSRMFLKGILESAGYQVRTAVDGLDAFTALREDGYDLVVSDVEMPRMNGFDLTARIRADKRLAELPVVLITALESRAERERGIDAGANAYVIKSSFDQQNLLEVVRRLV
jgi:two-component system chemotaxis sensor kinase CheA